MGKEIHGNTANIRQSVLAELSELYTFETGEDFVTYALLERMAALTGVIGREIAVHLSRAGKVADVSVGDAKTVTVPELRLVRNADRLCGVRCPAIPG